MNKIEKTFVELKKKKQTAFIPFVTVGDPDLHTTLDILNELQKAGANLIELGVPYSDPLADGPVIQRATERALKNKITILDVMMLAKRAREANIDIPFILFTYYNPLLQLGFDYLFKIMKESGINGLIIPDLPVEESEHVRFFCRKYEIAFIPLVAPTSKERIGMIVQHAAGFIYCVSSLGVTGQRNSFYDGMEQFIASVKKETSLPIVVGFGISNRDHVKQFSNLCDGVIVGSAIVQKIEENLDLFKNVETHSYGVERIAQFVSSLVN